MGEILVLSSDDGMETMKNRGKSSEVVQWEKYLPKTVLRVLLVEYDDSTRQIISALLRKCCYKVVAVSDGLAAWEILKEKSHNIDLILTELDLPSISGFALLALVMEHEACKNIPVIMMSSQDSITMVLKCMLRGAADYLIKPMRKNELKNLWQHAWRRLTSLRSDPTAQAQSLPGSQQNLENTDETSADSRYYSDQRSGAQATSYNGHNKLMEDAKSLNEREECIDSSRVDKKLESFGVTMDLIGGIDNRPECVYGDNTRDEYVGPELGLSLKRSCSGSFENQDESKHQKLSLSDVSAFSRFENSKPEEKTMVALEANCSGEPKTPSESHEKLRKVKSDQGSATTSSNQENIGSSSMSGQCVQKDLRFRNQIPPSTVTNQVQHPQDSALPVESNRLKASKELEVGSQSTCNNSEVLTGQSSSTEKPKEEENVNVQQSWSRSQREAALMKFRMKRKDRCFDKKVRYQSRKKLAEQRPRVKGQFVRTVNSDSSTKA